MQLFKEVTLSFTGDDTSSTLAVDLLAAPTSLSGTPSGLISGTNLTELDPEFRVVSPRGSVPAAPSMSDCSLAGTVLTATFSGTVAGDDLGWIPGAVQLDGDAGLSSLS